MFRYQPAWERRLAERRELRKATRYFQQQMLETLLGAGPIYWDAHGKSLPAKRSEKLIMDTLH